MLNLFDEEGVRYEYPKLKVMGVEAVKSSTPEICRTKIKEAIRVIMNESEDDLIKYVAEFKEAFKKLSPEEVAFPRSCNNLTKFSDSSMIYKNNSSKIEANSDLSTFFSLAISEKTSINSLFTKTPPNL